jgi:hypothetical protein
MDFLPCHFNGLRAGGDCLAAKTTKLVVTGKDYLIAGGCVGCAGWTPGLICLNAGVGGRWACEAVLAIRWPALDSRSSVAEWRQRIAKSPWHVARPLLIQHCASKLSSDDRNPRLLHIFSCTYFLLLLPFRLRRLAKVDFILSFVSQLLAPCLIASTANFETSSHSPRLNSLTLHCS